MKILHIIPSLKAGGAERLVLDICRELTQQGHEVKLIILHNVNHYKKLSSEVDFHFLDAYVHPSVFGKWDIRLAPLNDFIENFKPDIIHSHLFEAEIVLRENIYQNIAYFSHCHDNMPQLLNFSLKTLFNKKLLTNFYEKQHLLKRYQKCNNKFIAISNDAKQYFGKMLPQKLSQYIFLLNNAIDFKRFNTVNKPRSLDKMRLVNIGSFVPKKNQQFLVEVVKELVENKMDVKLLLLGEGPLLNEVKEKINNYGLQDFIECTGNVEHVEEYLAESNIYVHSATYEPFGLVLLEAMASGLPVVSLDGRGNRDIMKDNENGFMLQQSDSKLFAEKIIQLYSNQELYNRISVGAVNSSVHYDIYEYVKRLVLLYQEAVFQRERRDFIN